MTKKAAIQQGAGGGAELEISTCYMCNKKIKPMEPFQLALAFDAQRVIRNVPYHQACEIDAVATAVGDEIEAMQEGEQAPSIADRLRDAVRDVLDNL